MNPEEEFYDDCGLCTVDNHHDDMMHEQQAARRLLLTARERSAKANKAFNDLCDALGAEFVGTSINAGSGYLNIPADQVQFIADRINAMKATSPLVEGAL